MAAIRKTALLSVASSSRRFFSANFIKFVKAYKVSSSSVYLSISPQVAICKTPFAQKAGDYQSMVIHKHQKAGLTYYLQVIVYKTMTLLLLLMLIKLLFPLSTPGSTTG